MCRAALFLVICIVSIQVGLAGDRQRVHLRSSFDGTDQPSYLILPAGFVEGRSYPLLVSLHSWSADLEQRNRPLENLVEQRGWIYLFPNFRGRNDNPQACGSPAAQQDILDAVAWAKRTYSIDERRIYLTGVSGGGHMTMLMAGRHPEVWTAASAWVGISDLTAWYRDTSMDRYREMMRAVCGGPPGGSAEIDQQYYLRSPLHYLDRAVGLPLDLAAGIHDGHEGSVSIRQTLTAFNVVAAASGGKTVTPSDIDRLCARHPHLPDSEQTEDRALGRVIHLRRTSGSARVTIFEGGHEGVAAAAVDWLAQHVRPQAEGLDRGR